jgi:putative membrane protein
MEKQRTFRLRDKIILRDYLALERTRLANERTLFSYIRTSLYLIIAGVAFLQLKEFINIRWVGYLLLALSVVVLLTGIINYRLLRKKISGFYTENMPNP